jgi:hypothetical protein
VSVFWFSEKGLESTYFDQRATIPQWAAPFLIATGTPTWVGGLTAVSTAPYTVEVFWASSSILSSSFTLDAHQETLPDGIVLRTVSHSAPSAPAQVAPSGSVSVGPGIAAVTTAPVGRMDEAGLPGAGAVSVFWLTEDQSIETTYRASAGAAWVPPVVLGAPIGENFSPILAVASATGDISLLVHAPDGTILTSRHRQAARLLRTPIIPPQV